MKTYRYILGALFALLFASTPTSAQPATQTTTFAHDVISRLTGVTYQDKSTASFDYDPNSNLTKVVHTDGSVVSYTYDPNDNQTSQKFKEVIAGVVTERMISYTYDPLNRKETVTYPGKIVVRNHYGPAGNLVSQEVFKPRASDAPDVRPEQAQEAMAKLRPIILNHSKTLVRDKLLQWVADGQVSFAANNFLPGMSSSLELYGKRRVLLMYNTQFVTGSSTETLEAVLYREARRVQDYIIYLEMTPPKK